MGSVSLRLVKVCRQIFWSCHFLSKVRDVGRENLCLRAQIAALQREKAVLECTARKFMHREQLAKAASFGETQISIFINGPVVPEVTVWYRVPMAMLWISVESKREETTGEIVKKLETEVLEANMEKAFEETVKKEVENNNREDKIMEK